MEKLEILEQRDSNFRVKWNQCGKNRIPMGVADMDFKVDERIAAAFENLTAQGDFGYAVYKTYEESILNWMSDKYNWNFPKYWLTFCPGTLSGIAILINILTNENDPVMILSPVYNRFFDVIENNGRKVVESELINVDGHYEIDFKDMESKLYSENIKLLLLSSPHNPVCRTWTIDEQNTIIDICRKYDVFIISDEIHADLAFSPHAHHPFLKHNIDYEENIIVTTSPSKAFNIPGLYIANFIIPNEEIRNKYLANIWAHPNIFGAKALEIAYNHCSDWLEEALSYIQSNFEYLEYFLSENTPNIKLIVPEATYLAWIDCRKLSLTQDELMEFFLEKAKIYVTNGEDYGKSGKGYVRMNVACSKTTMKEAMSRLKKAYDLEFNLEV